MDWAHSFRMGLQGHSKTLELFIAKWAPTLLVIVIIVLFAILISIVVFFARRASRRERLVTAALQAGQPGLALYLSQGPRRILATLVLLASVVFIVMAFNEREEELGFMVMPVALVSAIVALKRTKLRAPNPPVAPGPLPAAAVPQPPPRPTPPAPPSPLAPPSPASPPPASPPRSSSFGSSIVRLIVAIALAIIIVFAGLILMRLWPLFVFLAAVVVLYVVMSGKSDNGGKARFCTFLGHQAGKTRDWLDRQAGDAPVTGNGPRTPNGPAEETPEETEKTPEETEGASEDDQG